MIHLLPLDQSAEVVGVAVLMYLFMYNIVEHKRVRSIDLNTVLIKKNSYEKSNKLFYLL